MSKTATKKAKQKKELTPKQQKTRTIMNWIINIICLIVIIFSLVVAVFTIVRSTNKDGVTDFFGTIYFSVMSDSMSPTFDKDDVVIGQKFEGNASDLKVGQVIIFKFQKGNEVELNAHRIAEINGSIIRTQGDNHNSKYNPDWVDKGDDDKDPYTVQVKNVVATWGEVDENGEIHNGKIMKKIGAFGNWFQDAEQGKTRFFCVIVLPLILLFVAYAYVLIHTLVINKIDREQKALALQAATAPVTVDSLSDEEKRRLAEEYLASMNNDGSQPGPDAVQDGAPADSVPESGAAEADENGVSDEGADK